MPSIWPVLVPSAAVLGLTVPELPSFTGNLHDVLPQPYAGAVLVLCSIVCGTVLGLERRARHKPAGLRTVILICVGSTVFTLVSVLVATDAGSDPGRIAAQVVTGVGFLGAGAIIRERGQVVGLTTAATIWVVAAIGVLVGAGYAAGGVGVALLVLVTLIISRPHGD